ncbi:MAG TPA: cellulase family glycosylhydrolase [Terriglobales bacterium]|jgi:endoglucanase
MNSSRRSLIGKASFLAFLVFLAQIAAPMVAIDQPHSFVHTDGTRLVDGEGHPLLLRGTNLGNWLVQEGYMFHFDHGPQSAREIEALTNELLGPEAADRFWHAYRERYVTRDDIQFLKRAGFNSIRIPIHYKYFLSDDAEGFTWLDRVIGWSHEAGLYVVIDMHCAPGGQTGANIDDSWGYPWIYDSPQAQQLTIDTWKRIAAHYRDSKTVLGYDLLNEPIPHFPELRKYNSKLEPLYRRIVAGIREVDKNHIVILGGAQWDTNFEVFGPPFDANVMYNFHKYWMPPVQSEIQAYVDFRDKYRVPIWMSESGENKDEWIAQFRELLEKNQIGWAFWPYKKMDAVSSPVSFARPVYWDEIVAYAKLPGGTGEVEKHLAQRPPQEHINAAFADLLDKIQFSQCRINQGYLKALGLAANN